MSEIDNVEDPDEIDIDALADEGADDADVLEGFVGDEEVAADIGETAESLLDDIKSDSFYSLKRQTEAEELDPGEILSDGVTVADGESKSPSVIGELAEQSDLDDPAGTIEIAEEVVEQVEVPDEEVYQFDFEQAERSRSRLRKILLVCVIILIVLAATIGAIFLFQSTEQSAQKPTEIDSMKSPDANASATEFLAIDAERLPNLVACFGKTPEEAVAASGVSLNLDAESSPASDGSLPGIKSHRTAWLVGDGGMTLGTITFGLNDQGVVEYVFASFDLDAFDVADSRFEELAADEKVAASVLVGVGVDEATVKSAQLSSTDNPAAIVARDMSKQEIAEFSGSTNLGSAPTTWKVIETYDHSVGISIGDNSVIRTLGVDLR